MLALLETLDPWLTTLGATNFHLTRLLHGFHATDSPQLCLAHPTQNTVHHHGDGCHLYQTQALATADMACITFFFLLQPDEYTTKPNSTAPCNIADVQLLHNDKILSWSTLPEPALLITNYVTYTFCSQKNGIRGKVLSQGHWVTLSAAPSKHQFAASYITSRTAHQ